MTRTASPPRHSFVVISDMHVPGDGLLFDRVDPLANLRDALRMIDTAAYRPDALVFAGDVAHGGQAAAYGRVRAVVGEFAEAWASPVLYLPGNHDHDPASFHSGLLDSTLPGADQVLMLGGLRLIGLDTCSPGNEYGVLGQDQLCWLASRLATPAPEGSIVILHHPPVRTPEPVVDSIGLQDPESFVDVIAGSDARMVIAGHTHHASGGNMAGRPVWLCPSLSFTTDVLAADAHRYLPGGAFTRVDVFDESVLATAVVLQPTDNPLFDMKFDEVFRLLGGADRVRV